MKNIWFILVCLVILVWCTGLEAETDKPEKTTESGHTDKQTRSEDESSAISKENQSESDAEVKSVDVITDRSELELESTAPSESFTGLTDTLKGTFKIDINKLKTLEGQIWFPVKSLRTGNSLRDRDMRAKPWLYSSKYPKIKYRAKSLKETSITRKDDQIRANGTVQGVATVRGTSSPTEADVKIAILPPKNLVRIKAKMEISLTNHEVPGEGGAIGDKVGAVIDVNALIYGSWE